MSETVLARSNCVRYKKIDGTLELLKNEVKWQSRDGHGRQFQCLYSDIKVQRISPETSSKVQLQVVLHDESSHSFHFTNSKGREVQMKERDNIKDLLAELIPKHRHKANKDLEEKNKLFKEQPELYQLYKELVVSGIITAQEFWENHKTAANPQTVIEKQDVGIASGFLAELKPDMHGCNELRFNLTADSINAIFKMYPAVKKKYVEIVPTEMTEKEFWTDFFKSQHFHRDRIPKLAGSTSKDMFGDLAKKDEKEQLKSLMETFFDPLIDFTSAAPNTEEGYGLKTRDHALQSHEILIKQFNHQSLMVLQNTRKRADTTDKESEVVDKKKRIREAVEYNELEEEKGGDQPTLQIVDTDKFSNDQTDGQINGHANGHHWKDINQIMLTFQQNVGIWKPQLSEVISAEVARNVISEVSPGGKYMRNVGKTNIADSFTKDMQQEMKKNYLSLAELLRHFWSCFPIKTPQLEEKVRRMAASLEKFRDTKLANFKCMLPNHSQQLGDHLSEMIEVALQKFVSWEERRGNKGSK